MTVVCPCGFSPAMAFPSRLRARAVSSASTARSVGEASGESSARKAPSSARSSSPAGPTERSRLDGSGGAERASRTFSVIHPAFGQLLGGRVAPELGGHGSEHGVGFRHPASHVDRDAVGCSAVASAAVADAALGVRRPLPEHPQDGHIRRRRGRVPRGTYSLFQLLKDSNVARAVAVPPPMARTIRARPSVWRSSRARTPSSASRAAPAVGGRDEMRSSL
jgi:hypothetical protein